MSYRDNRDRRNWGNRPHGQSNYHNKPHERHHRDERSDRGGGDRGRYY